MPDATRTAALPFTDKNTVRLGEGSLALMEDEDTDIQVVIEPVALAGTEDVVDLLHPSPRGPVNPAVVKITGHSGFLAAAVDTRRDKIFIDTHPHTDHLIASSMALALSERQAAESVPLNELLPVTQVLDDEMPKRALTEDDPLIF